jgi:hypothetical protein
MAQQNEGDKTGSSYRYLHLSIEELAQLPREELLEACLELRQLLELITGVLYTPEMSLTIRAVTMDLLYTQAQRVSRQQGTGETSPVTYDIKATSQRLGVRPVEIQRAYEHLEALGGVHILARQFPNRQRQQLRLPLAETGTNESSQVAE